MDRHGKCAGGVGSIYLDPGAGPVSKKYYPITNAWYLYLPFLSDVIYGCPLPGIDVGIVPAGLGASQARQDLGAVPLLEMMDASDECLINQDTDLGP